MPLGGLSYSTGIIPVSDHNCRDGQNADSRLSIGSTPVAMRLASIGLLPRECLQLPSEIGLNQLHDAISPSVRIAVLAAIRFARPAVDKQPGLVAVGRRALSKRDLLRHRHTRGARAGNRRVQGHELPVKRKQHMGGFGRLGRTLCESLLRPIHGTRRTCLHETRTHGRRSTGNRK